MFKEESTYIKNEIKQAQGDLELTLTDTSTIILMKQLLKEFGLGLKKLVEQHKNEEKTSDSQLRNQRKTPSLYEGESYEKIANMAKSNLIYKLKDSRERA